MRILLAGLLIAAAFAAQAQSSGGGGSSGSSGSAGSSRGGSMSSPMGGGSSGSVRTEQAPSGTMRTGPDQVNPGGGSAVMGGNNSATSLPDQSARGGGTRGSGQQAQVPDMCKGPINDPSCEGASNSTGTGWGNRGTAHGPKDRYGPEDSPVKGGPSFEGPTGRPLNLPNEGR